jgi:hypothetical protein
MEECSINAGQVCGKDRSFEEAVIKGEDQGFLVWVLLVLDVFSGPLEGVLHLRQLSVGDDLLF